jgi:cytoplasmic iron level regulating protein YaaA (DUF328/UPF0246 family)
MKILISPAKSLDFEKEIPISQSTECLFLAEAERLSNVLKKKSSKKLIDLMHISPNLAALNRQRNLDWHLPFSSENARQAIYAFTGEVYLGIDVHSIPLEKIGQLQDKLRIISGQYGLLKPLDLIQPYRLEMGTRLKVGRKDNLYKFWDNKITNALNDELKDQEPIINLASNEYFKAIKPSILKSNIITPIFKDFKNGQYKTIMTFAKRARGLMVRYIIDNNIETVDGLKQFNTRGYAFDTNLSTANDFVFTR